MPPPDPALAALAVDLDTDYVDAFRRFVDASLALRDHGIDVPRLLDRSRAAFLVGDAATSLEDARDACDLAPDDPEAWFQLGSAALTLAAVGAGAIPPGPGFCGPSSDLGPAAAVQVAHDAFGNAARLRPADTEARRAVASTAALLDKVRRAQETETA